MEVVFVSEAMVAWKKKREAFLQVCLKEEKEWMYGLASMGKGSKMKK